MGSWDVSGLHYLMMPSPPIQTDLLLFLDYNSLPLSEDPSPPGHIWFFFCFLFSAPLTHRILEKSNYYLNALFFGGTHYP